MIVTIDHEADVIRNQYFFIVKVNGNSVKHFCYIPTENGTESYSREMKLQEAMDCAKRIEDAGTDKPIVETIYTNEIQEPTNTVELAELSEVSKWWRDCPTKVHFAHKNGYVFNSNLTEDEITDIYNREHL